jgi:hypothetical protein
VTDLGPAAPGDVDLADQRCVVEAGRAVAGGTLTNRTGEEHGFVITVDFTDDGRILGSRQDEIETALEDGATWAWEVVFPVDDTVDTDGLNCAVSEVELGEVVES